MKKNLPLLFLFLILIIMSFSSFNIRIPVHATSVIDLYINSFYNEYHASSTNGTSPWLDKCDGKTNSIYTVSASYVYDQYYLFDTTTFATVTSASLWVCLKGYSGPPTYADAQCNLWNGTAYRPIAAFMAVSGNWENMSVNIFSLGFNTHDKIDNTKLQIGIETSHAGFAAYFTAVWLHVSGYGVYTSTPTTIIDTTVSAIMAIMIPLLFLFLPALILGEMIGVPGVLAGIALGAVCLGVVGLLPLWAILLVGLALIIIVIFGRDRL